MKVGGLLENVEKQNYIFHSKEFFKSHQSWFLKYFYFRNMLLNTISYNRTILMFIHYAWKNVD